MAQKTKSQSKVKVKDLKPVKNPKGGKGFGEITVTKPVDKSSP